MSPQFDRIRQYIDQYDGDDYVSIESGNPTDEADLQKISGAIPIALPPVYVEFLTTFGTLDIGGCEFAGSSDADYLNVIAIREELIRDLSLPETLIPLLNEDGDSYVCIDSGGALLRWTPGHEDLYGLNETFADYLLRLCDELIADETDDE